LQWRYTFCYNQGQRDIM